MQSDIIEFRRDTDGVDHVRRKEGWEKLVLKMELRDRPQDMMARGGRCRQNHEFMGLVKASDSW